MSNVQIPSRAPGLQSRRVDDETIVLDQATKEVHLLSGVAAQVWEAAADGSAPDAAPADLKAAVAELVEKGLLVDSAGMTRRTMLQRTALTAGVIGFTTLALPPAAYAASGDVSVTLTPASGRAGTAVTVSGRTGSPGQALTVYFNGVQVQTGAGNNGNGNYSVAFQVPNGTSPGTYPVRVVTATGSGTAFYTVVA